MKITLWVSNPTRLLGMGLKNIFGRRQGGMVLISSLLILASVCLIAFGLAGDSTTELRIAGNRRLHQQAFALSDGGATVGIQVILDYLDASVDTENDYPGSEEKTLIDGSLYMSNFHTDDDIGPDLMGFSQNDNAQDPGNGRRDVSFELSSTSGAANPDSRIMVDVDRIAARLLPGSSIEFAAGYEGIGKGAGTGSVGIYYAVDSVATTPTQSNNSATSEVTTVYRKVSNVIGGAQ